MEFLVITNWLSWPADSSLINVPGLVQSVVAVVVDNMSVVMIVTSVNIKALSSNVSNVSSWTIEPSDLLVWLVLPLSDYCSNINSEALSSLVGESIVSSSPGSDGSGSGIESPPLSVVLWTVVSDSKSELVSTNVLMPEESSSVLHERLNLELNSVSKWVSWVVNSLSVNVPSLVQSIVAVPEDDVSHVVVVSSMNIKALLGQVSDVSSSSTIEEGSLEVGVNEVSHDSSNIDSPSVSLLV